MAASTLILLSNDVALNPGNPKDQCSICKKICRSNQMAIQYDSCDAWFHTKCIEMPSKEYSDLSKASAVWMCITCLFPSPDYLSYDEPETIPSPIKQPEKIRRMLKFIFCEDLKLRTLI